MCKESHDFLPFVILGESGPKVPAFPGMLTSSIQFDLTTIVCLFPPLSMHGPIWCFRKTRGSVRTTQVKVNSPTVSPPTNLSVMSSNTEGRRCFSPYSMEIFPVSLKPQGGNYSFR